MADGLFGTNVSAPRLRQTALQPAGIPGSTYVRPEQREVGTNLDRLASALGNLNGALSSFAGRMEAKANDPNTDENKLYNARLQQMSLEELRAEAKSPTALGSKIKRDALDVLISARATEAFRNEWLGYYNGGGFDRTNGNIEADYQAMQTRYLEMLPSEIAQGHFVNSNRDHFTQWQAEDTKQKSAYVMGEISTSVQSMFRVTDQDMVANGASAEDRAAAVFSIATSSGEYLSLPRQGRDDAIYALAAEYAVRGDHEMVSALLTQQRTDENGNRLPALIANPAFTVEAQKLIETAQNVWEADVRENGFSTYVADDEHIRNGTFTKSMAEARRGTGLYTDKELADRLDQSNAVRLRAEAEFAKGQAAHLQGVESRKQESQAVAEAFSLMTRLAGSNRIHDVEVLAETGDGSRTVTREQIIEQVVQRSESGWRDKALTLQQQGMTPEQAERVVHAEKVQFYSMNRLDNPEWSDTLNGIAQRATIENVMELGNVTPELIANAELYRTLMAQNPAYLNTQLTNADSRAFLELYDNAVSVRRMEPAHAMQLAAAETAKPEYMRAKSLLPPDRVQGIAQGVLRDLGFDDDRAGNYSYVTERATQMALGGMTEREIKDRLRAEIEQTTVNINGKLIPDHRDLPGDFPVLIEERLKATFEVFGERHGLESWEDLSVVPMSGQSKWMVIDKRTEQPIGSIITPEALDAERRRAEHLRDLAVLEQVAADDSKRAEAEHWYNERIRNDRAQIDKFRSRSGAASQWIADYLEGVLEDRLRRDEALRNMTPEKAEAELEQLREFQRRTLINGPSSGTGGGFDPFNFRPR